jgi:uncharacterized membrane protein
MNEREIWCAGEVPMNASHVLLFAFLIGIVAGLRSLMAPTTVAWGTRLGWINLHGTLLNFMGTTIGICFFSVLALVELIVDKLPSTPARTKPAGLIARILLGGLAGAALGLAGAQSWLTGGILGGVGGIVGAFAGSRVRTGIVKALKVPDMVVALLEDAIAIGAGLFIVSRI